MVSELTWLEQLSQGEIPPPLSPQEIRVSAKVGGLKICLHRKLCPPRAHLLSPRSKFFGWLDLRKNQTLVWQWTKKTAVKQNKKNCSAATLQVGFVDWRLGISRKQLDQPTRLHQAHLLVRPISFFDKFQFWVTYWTRWPQALSLSTNWKA